ncbi:MAG: zf-HC2 domain-containing protein [Chloroflexi bacterium]|nr:zf-HC2 domain-containing protein [Chloroflexota bacterium]
MLSPYLDGQVTPAERASVEAHVEACSVCADELQGLESLKSMLSQLPSRPAPRSFAIGPRPVQTAPALSGTIAGFARALTSLAAVLLLAAVGLNWLVAGLPRQQVAAAPAVTSFHAAASSTSRATQAQAPQPAAGAGAQSSGVAAPSSVAARQAPAAAAAPNTAARPPAPANVAQPVNPQPAGDESQPASPAGGTASAGPPPGAPAPSPLNVPLLVAECAAALLAIGIGLYSLRWWRR